VGEAFAERERKEEQYRNRIESWELSGAGTAVVLADGSGLKFVGEAVVDEVLQN